MTTTRLRYSADELLTDPRYEARIERDGVLLHGGYGPVWTKSILPVELCFRHLSGYSYTGYLACVDSGTYANVPAPKAALAITGSCLPTRVYAT